MGHCDLLIGTKQEGCARQNDNSEPERNGAERPNIIFLLADDLGYGDVQYNGGIALTPNINEMASGEHSIRFDRFYSSSPVCSPTRGSLLTGRNHNRYCIWMANTVGKKCKIRNDFLCRIRYPLPASELTVAEMLKEEGYYTAVFGKWHLGDLGISNKSQETSNPGDNGFDVWKVTERAVPTSNPNCACFNVSQCNLGHYQRRGPPPCTNYHGTVPDKDGILMSHPNIILKDDSEFIADEFSKFLNKIMNDEDGKKLPFFAYIPFHSVHKNYIASPPYDALYYNMTFNHEQVDYYASITALDTAIGRIRTLLKHFNISDNTMLWFSSDNGPSEKSSGLTAGLRGKKGSLYEGGIRVPGIIEWPKVIKGNRISNHPVVTSDFVPTVIESLGLKTAEKELDGISLLSLLQNKTKRDSTGAEIRNSTIKWAFNIRGNFNNNFKAAIMNNNCKLIANYKRGSIKSYKLYNLTTKPTESLDIATKHPELTTSLLSQVTKWITSIKKSAKQNKCLLTV